MRTNRRYRRVATIDLTTRACIALLALSATGCSGEIGTDFAERRLALGELDIPLDHAACNNCHSLHTASYPTLLGQLCQYCHVEGGPGDAVLTHSSRTTGTSYGNWDLDCWACHDAHGKTTNMALVREKLEAKVKQIDPNDLGPYWAPVSILRTVTSNDVTLTNEGEFVDGDSSTSDDLCQVCHQQTSSYSANAVNVHSQLGADSQPGGKCLSCHAHSSGFRATGCVECHDQAQGSRRAIVGPSGDFSAPSHHAGAVTNADCVVCHDTSDHKAGTIRLKDPDQGSALIYSYDPQNPASLEAFCLNCHDSDGASAAGGTTPFADGQTVPAVASGWSSSAHKTLPNPANHALTQVSCLSCHSSGHGSPNVKLLKGSLGANGDQIHTLCLSCHTDSVVKNDSLSQSDGVDDIAQAFAVAADGKHDLGTTFTVGSASFTLQCTTCHNPHLDSGTHRNADQGLSPVTLPDFSDAVKNPRAMGRNLWGDTPTEKIATVAASASGTYRPPNGDTATAEQLPDYVTFCQSCHAEGVLPGGHGGIKWDATDPHGANAANIPNGGTAAPNGAQFAKADGWDGDDCVSTQASCWPVLPSGRGEQVFTRAPYSQEERIAGANFYLACTDCHEAHGSAVGAMLRAKVNAGAGTSDWTTMCDNCHDSGGDWHANASCGSASCHTSSRMTATGTTTIHGMANATGLATTRTFNRDLVASFSFENNLNDAGDFRLHGGWRTSAGAFVPGRFGQAIEITDQPIEVGTTDAFWATDEEKHGTWKYSEMKYQMSLEAWIYPTVGSGERKILAKHTYTNGGYALVLKNIGGVLRVALHTLMTVGGSNDCGGLRGAYSSVAIPLSQWTHVGATFDHLGPDRDSSDNSVGRIRIYVNGEDVTASNADPAQCFAQPGAGETTMHPYSAHSPLNESICEGGHWCASTLSVGGLNESAPAENFVGRLDEVKLWNVTKDAAYFAAYDAQAAPRIDKVSGSVGSDQLSLTFSEGVYASATASGALEVADFVLTDSDNNRTVVAVSHTAGSNIAQLTLSSALDLDDDIGVDTLAAASNAIYDEHGNAALTALTTTIVSEQCPPAGLVTFALNETTNTIVRDASKLLVGAVQGTPLGNGVFTGDGASTCVSFSFNPSCLKATRAMTLEARIKPTGIPNDTTTNYIKRIFARDSGGNYQLSVWRDQSWTNFSAPANTASIALWVKPKDAGGGESWKPVLSDYTLCPVVSDHWYQVKVTWDSDKASGIPADIYIDDQGSDGNGAGEAWSGLVNCTNAAQSYNDTARQLATGDEIAPIDGTFAIGCSQSNPADNVFLGQIDWISWQP